MKKLANLFCLLIICSLGSCVKDAGQHLVLDANDESGFITERKLLKPTKCNCSYEILDVKSLDFEDFEYVFSNVGQGQSLCSNCQNGLFTGHYDGCEETTFTNPCQDEHADPIPNGWFPFNCPVEANSSFLSGFYMLCCDDDPNCDINSQIRGEITFRMRCKQRRIIAHNPRAIGCDQTFTSEPITIPFDSNVGPVASLKAISLEGECGCSPVAQ